ncbi:hypothetical protein B0T16DRAFT_455428 [Cercophora newfieldiana]|uniref:Uncharacterized protein n=1 Tax=Cercophora newfieldiana TaxID=92897 RepID=A0AA39YI86_9PEZI|nr:hypothetical protein B0T16DRAFT_455428 [Cercophora newfieldiana]
MASTRRNLRPASWPWDRHSHRDDTAVPAVSDIMEQAKTESAATVEEVRPVLDRGLWTRDLCIVGLILAWGASIACMATAIYIIASGALPIPPWLLNRQAHVGPVGLGWVSAEQPYMVDHRLYGVSEGAMIAIPLLLQIAIASISLCLDSIHSTTLRWALWREGRLHHNTNIRLFTFARSSGPNAWPANIVSSLGLALAYSGASMATFPVTVIGVLERKGQGRGSISLNTDIDPGPDRYGISFNSWGLLGLGIGLLLQSTICTWCLVHDANKRIVGTWNSNPLATARACQALLDRDSGSGSPGHRQNLTLSVSTPKQPSMRTLAPPTRTITNWIWAVFAIQSLFTIAVSIVAKTQDRATIDIVRKYDDDVTFFSIWKFYGQVVVIYNWNSKSRRLEWAGLLIQSAFLSILLFALHLADVLAGLARDEAIWRRAATTGASPDSNALLDGLRSWPTCVVFVFKAIVPWIFSFGVACITRLFLTISPLLTVAVLFLILACCAEWIIRAQPRGPQPSTYGDVRALAMLIDDWGDEGDGTIFWGEKGLYEWVEGVPVRLAGTAGRRLADLQPGLMYAGLSGEAEIS